MDKSEFYYGGLGNAVGNYQFELLNGKEEAILDLMSRMNDEIEDLKNRVRQLEDPVEDYEPDETPY